MVGDCASRTDMAVSAAFRAAAWSFRWSERATCPRKKLSRIANDICQSPIRFSATWSAKSFVVRASDPQRGSNEAENSGNSTGTFISPEDWGYLAKLLAGSVLGAAAIKYGSAVFPVITRPNIVQALIMIITPVVVAVFLLIKESNLDSED